MNSYGKVIRVSEDVYKFLEKEAKAFESPNDVIRRLIGLPPKSRKGRPSPKKGRKS